MLTASGRLSTIELKSNSGAAPRGWREMGWLRISVGGWWFSLTTSSWGCVHWEHASWPTSGCSACPCDLLSLSSKMAAYSACYLVLIATTVL